MWKIAEYTDRLTQLQNKNFNQSTKSEMDNAVQLSKHT